MLFTHLLVVVEQMNLKLQILLLFNQFVIKENIEKFYFLIIDCGSSPCTFNINYADGSYINGYIGKDVLSIANLKTTIEFGIINSASPSFEIVKKKLLKL